MLDLVTAFDLKQNKQLVAIVGGGGKTSLMFRLAEELSGRVIATTTTRIFAAQMKLAPAVCRFPNPNFDRCLSAGLDRHSLCLVVGQVEGEKARGVPPEIVSQWLNRPDVDAILVEADGSRMKPCKAPAEHEPVIPAKASLVIPVAGIDAVGGRLSEIAHRPERVANLTSLDLNDEMTTDALATLLCHKQGGLKSVPPTARVMVLINKVEDEHQLGLARQVARCCLDAERIDRVIIGAIKTGKPILEVHRRVTAVLLAAGASARMGQTKQLLPWGDTTMLGQVIANLQASAVNEIVVVTGHDRDKTTAIAEKAGVKTVHNPDYEAGGMLSSLQAAVNYLPTNRGAVLVALADQPLVEPGVINRLLEAYWQGSGQIIAPAYDGERGNPVLFDRHHFPELLALPWGEAPRTLLKRHTQAVTLVPVDSAAVLLDLDTQQLYRRWRPK